MLILFSRYWIFGCISEDSSENFVSLAVHFFSSKDPKDTPEFCGCILSTRVLGDTSPASKELVKECYFNAIKGGPSQRTSMTRSSKKMKQRKMNKNHRRRMKKKGGNRQKRMNVIQHNRKSLKNLKKMMKKMKAERKPQTGRSKREAFDEDVYLDYFEEDYFDEEDLKEEELEEEFLEENMYEEEDLEERMFKDMDIQLETGLEEYEDNLVNGDFEEDFEYDDFNISSDLN